MRKRSLLLEGTLIIPQKGASIGCLISKGTEYETALVQHDGFRAVRRAGEASLGGGGGESSRNSTIAAAPLAAVRGSC